MTFSETAIKLAGHVALLLGWKPDDFWNATPAELAAVLSAMPTHNDSAGGETLEHLMKVFPDTQIGGE